MDRWWDLIWLCSYIPPAPARRDVSMPGEEEHTTSLQRVSQQQYLLSSSRHYTKVWCTVWLLFLFVMWSFSPLSCLTSVAITPLTFLFFISCSISLLPSLLYFHIICLSYSVCKLFKSGTYLLISKDYVVMVLYTCLLKSTLSVLFYGTWRRDYKGKLKNYILRDN